MPRLPEPFPPSGVLNIYKPVGLTSHDVVSRVRRILNTKKVGHLGTLDPLAEGVLPLCIGSCTRLIDYFPSGKSYQAELVFGKISETLDREGPITTVDPAPTICLEALYSVLENFKGAIQQKVPMHSAVHVNGQRLYSLARKGEVLAPDQIPTRSVTIESLSVKAFLPHAALGPTLKIEIQCSSGTYIRSLVRDIGEAIGCGAYMSALLRTSHGFFNLKNAVSLESLALLPHPRESLLSPMGFVGLPVVLCSSPECISFLAHGKVLPLEALKRQATTSANTDVASFYLVVSPEKQLPVAVVCQKASGWQPVKVFIPTELLSPSLSLPSV